MAYVKNFVRFLYVLLGSDPGHHLYNYADKPDVTMQELVEGDPMAARVYESFKPFYDAVRDYHHISEQAYINARDQVMDN